MKGRLTPWGKRPKRLTQAEGRALASAIIAWRERGYPAPDGEDSDDGPLDRAMTSPGVETLRLGGLALDALPSEFADIDGVECLFLDKNALHDLPAALARQPLTTLSVTGNPLTALPPEILGIATLTDLYLSMTKLRELPVLAHPHPALRVLGLQSLPGLDLGNEALATLPMLRTLLLGDSGLETLPASVCALQHLIQLDLEGNPLTALPEGIGRLGHLVALNLGRCRLTTLPKAVGQLDSLMKGAGMTDFFGLVIEGNPFADEALTRIAALRNPERTAAALAWAREHGS